MKNSKLLIVLLSVLLASLSGCDSFPKGELVEVSSNDVCGEYVGFIHGADVVRDIRDGKLYHFYSAPIIKVNEC